MSFAISRSRLRPTRSANSSNSSTSRMRAVGVELSEMRRPEPGELSTPGITNSTSASSSNKRRTGVRRSYIAPATAAKTRRRRPFPADHSSRKSRPVSAEYRLRLLRVSRRNWVQSCSALRPSLVRCQKERSLRIEPEFPIITRASKSVLTQSCLIQDEPGGGAGFSYKMSLEERSRMLGFDHQRADIGTVEPGADSGVFGRQFRGRIQGPESRGGIRLGGSDATAATIRRADPQRAWIGAAVRGED